MFDEVALELSLIGNRGRPFVVEGDLPRIPLRFLRLDDLHSDSLPIGFLLSCLDYNPRVDLHT